MRIVIKVGTSTLAHKGGRLNIRRVEVPTLITVRIGFSFVSTHV